MKLLGKKVSKQQAKEFFRFYKNSDGNINVQDLDGLPNRRGWTVADYEAYVQRLHQSFMQRASTQRKETERLDFLLSDKFPDIVSHDGSVVCDREHLDDIIDDFYA